MEQDIISKMDLEKLKNHLRIRHLMVNGRKNELVARVFAASKNAVKPIKTVVPHWLVNEDEGMKFWVMLLYPDIFIYFMFSPQSLVAET